MSIFKGRYTAQIEGDFVIFLIGLRINNLFAFNRWSAVGNAMPRMLTELYRQPELGLLHHEMALIWRGVLMVQYWRSFDQLHAYAHARNAAHLPAWAEFNRRVGADGTVGIYHETYEVKASHYESVYANMPKFGLAAAREAQHVPAIGRLNSARDRIRQDSQSQPEVTT